ncbi:hypothetical protein [Actinoplanes sp. NPDC023714]|uniref:hypothetical protein n=1 Tax=Actinoplanes sp. NPDC023714 TaxID=3154322 RepID=UPI00341043F1
MKQTTKRWLAAVAAVAAFVAVNPAPAQAAPNFQRQRLIATAYYGTMDIIARETLGLKARFVTVGGRPVPNLIVNFVTTGERFPMCEATTDLNGWAECRNGPIPPPQSLANLLVNGYDAVFDGNRYYYPVAAHNNIGIG